MSGHSKWSTIKRKKAITDAKKGATFSKMSKFIQVAARNGADPDANAPLRLAVEKAKEARMPKDNIEKAILKGSGQLEGERLEEVVYEGFGPNGEAFMLKIVTDNTNRTVAELRNMFNRVGGSLGNSGSTAYIFGDDPENPSYVIEVSDESLVERLSNFVEDLEDHDDVQDVYYNFRV